VIAGVLLTVVLSFAGSLAPFYLRSAIPIPITALAISVVGWFLLTRRDPAGAGEHAYGRARRTVRVTQGITALVVVSAWFPRGLRSPEVAVCLSLLNALAAIASALGQFAALRYLRRLAARIPDDALERRARLLTFGLAIPYAVTQLLGLAPSLLLMIGKRDLWFGYFEIFSVLMVLPALIVFGFGIPYLLFLRRLARRLRAEARADRVVAAAI
jgi:hypothetical protein